MALPVWNDLASALAVLNDFERAMMANQIAVMIDAANAEIDRLNLPTAESDEPPTIPKKGEQS